MVDWTMYYKPNVEEDETDYVQKARWSLRDIIDYHGDSHLTEIGEVEMMSNKITELAEELEDTTLREFTQSEEAPEVKVTPQDLAVTLFASTGPGLWFAEEKVNNLDPENVIYLHDYI